jgi:hypothetical protein
LLTAALHSSSQLVYAVVFVAFFSAGQRPCDDGAPGTAADVS